MAAITLVSTVTVAPGVSGGTTAAITTTGATLLVVSIGYYVGGTATLSDSKGNTYTGLTARNISLVAHRLWYCLSPTVGTGHTFTVGGGSTYPAMIVYAFAGVTGYQIESGATASLGVTSLASGSVTPSASGAVVVTGACPQDASTDTVTPVGFTVTTLTFSSGTNMQGSAAYYVQPAAAAINPTWAFNPAQAGVAVGTAVFLNSAAGGAVESVQPILWVPV